MEGNIFTFSTIPRGLPPSFPMGSILLTGRVPQGTLPNLDWMGVPPLGIDGGTSPSRTGRGTPIWTGLGYPPSRTGRGYPTPSGDRAASYVQAGGLVGYLDSWIRHCHWCQYDCLTLSFGPSVSRTALTASFACLRWLCMDRETSKTITTSFCTTLAVSLYHGLRNTIKQFKFPDSHSSL